MTKYIIAPAANPNSGNVNGSNNHTAIAAGTAATGCGKLVSTAKQKHRTMLAPRARIGSATANPSGMLCTAIAAAI